MGVGVGMFAGPGVVRLICTHCNFSSLDPFRDLWFILVDPININSSSTTIPFECRYSKVTSCIFEFFCIKNIVKVIKIKMLLLFGDIYQVTNKSGELNLPIIFNQEVEIKKPSDINLLQIVDMILHH
jgi:hypothetical protein